MTSFDYDKTRLTVDEPLTLPKPENDDFPVAAPWQTPAEAIQMIRRWIQEMRQELATDFTLRSCPEHRRKLDRMLAMEQCVRWHHCRRRQH